MLFFCGYNTRYVSASPAFGRTNWCGCTRQQAGVGGAAVGISPFPPTSSQAAVIFSMQQHGQPFPCCFFPSLYPLPSSPLPGCACFPLPPMAPPPPLGCCLCLSTTACLIPLARPGPGASSGELRQLPMCCRLPHTPRRGWGTRHGMEWIPCHESLLS